MIFVGHRKQLTIILIGPAVIVAHDTCDAALPFDPRDAGAIAAAVERVLEDGQLRQTMVARGYEQVRGFTWARCAQQVLGVLERVAGEPA